MGYIRSVRAKASSLEVGSVTLAEAEARANFSSGCGQVCVERHHKLVEVKMGNDYKFILFLIIGIIFFAIYLFGRKIDNYNPETQAAIGVIDRINQNDSGDSWHYVRLLIDGKEYRAKTDTYRRSPKDVAIGDTVNVQYRHIANGQVACYINQQGFERVIGSSGQGKPISLYCAMAFFAMFVFFAIKHWLR